MVGGAIGLVALSSEREDLAKQGFVVPRGDTEGFQVGSPGRLDVPAAPGGAGQRGVHGKLVRSRMEAQLVRPQAIGDRRMVGQRLLQRGNISFVVHTFFQIADKPGREADQLHPALPALVGNNVVFRQACRLRRLIHAQLNLVLLIPSLANLVNVIGHVEGVPQRLAVFDGGPHAGRRGQFHPRPIAQLNNLLPVFVETGRLAGHLSEPLL